MSDKRRQPGRVTRAEMDALLERLYATPGPCLVCPEPGEVWVATRTPNGMTTRALYCQAHGQMVSACEDDGEE